MTGATVRRWIVRSLLFVASLVLTAWLVLQTPWGKARVKDFVVRQVAGAVDGEISVERLEGGLWSSATLRGVRIRQAGVVVLAVDHVAASYNMVGLLGGDIRLSRLDVDGLTVTVEEGTNGWAVKGLSESDAADSDAGGTFAFPEIHLTRGHIVVVPAVSARREMADVTLDGGVMMSAGNIQVSSSRFSGREVTAGLVVRQMAGRLELSGDQMRIDELTLETAQSRLTGRAQMSVGASPMTTEGHLVSDTGVSLPEFAPYLGAIGTRTLRPSFDLTWNGPLSAVQVKGTVQSGAGDITTDVVANLTETMAVVGTVRVVRLDLGPLLADPEYAGRFSGDATIDLRFVESAALGVTGTFDGRLSDVQLFGYAASTLKTKGRIDATGVSANVDGAAYGAATQAAVRWTAATEVFAAQGDVQHLDVRRLPAVLDFYPALETSVNAAYQVTIAGTEWSAKATLQETTLEGATLAAGTTVDIKAQGEDLTYHAVGRVSNLDTQRLAPSLKLESAYLRETPLTVDAVFDVSGAGRTELKSHDMTFAFRELSANVDGALMQGMDGQGTLVYGRLTLAAQGRVAGVWDRLVLMPEAELRPVGHMVVDVVIDDVTAEEIPFESMTGVARVTLGRSSLSGLDVDRALVHVRFAAGTATFTETSVTGNGIDATVEGALAVSGSGTSNLTFVVDAPDLRPVSEFAGTALEGAAHAEGTITGSATAPEITGHARGTQLVYDAVRLLGLDSTFQLVAPEWDMARLRGDAKVNSVFIEVAGQTLQRAIITAKLDGVRTDVEAVLEQPDRRLNASATILLNPEGREASVTRADLSSAGETWQLAAGATGRIQQTAGALSIEGLSLVNGDQRISIAGALATDASGPAAEGIVVRADGVAVGGLFKILVGEDRVKGQLGGEVRITGSLADPQVTSRFDVGEGTADDVPFRSFSGKADYTSGEATLDVKLDVDDSAQLTVVGTVPVAAADAGAGTPLRVQVAGKIPNVAVLGPALPWVRDLKGAADVDVLLTGTIEKLLATGTAGMQEVEFRVPELGAKYRGLNAALRFDETVMVVDRFVILDEDGHPLRMEGSLDVLASEASKAVNLRARADEFLLLRNEFGELVISADLTAGGDLVTPNVLGTIRVERGRVEVDRLLREFVVAQGYIALGPVGTPPPSADAEIPPLPVMFVDSAVSIELVLPDNVVVRGRGIQTEEGVIGLGDVNLTVGGRLSIRKTPGNEMALLGEVAVVRGTYDFQGRRFDIVRGSVLRFRGDDMTNPTLDITAEREITGVEVTIRIRGTAAEPSLTLSSQPPLDQADILSLVAFGRPISQLGEGERTSLAARATTVAAGALATPLADSVARALDLDVFEIQTGEGVGAGTTVVVGRQVSDKLFVGFRHEFGTAGAQRLSFEYRLTEFLRIVSTISTGGDAADLSARTEAAGLDLIFVIRR